MTVPPRPGHTPAPGPAADPGLAAASGSVPPAAGGPGARRAHATAVLGCLVGAGLAFYAVTRTWSLTVEHRTGLTDLDTPQTGADNQPWLVGIAVVALAGAGALLATQGLLRRVLGVLLTLAGAGIIAGAVLARVSLDAGSAGAGAYFWPFATVLGGAAVAAGGLLAARHGHLWSGMSSRYDRAPATPSSARPDVATPVPFDVSRESGHPRETTGVPPVNLRPPDNRSTWDALDRGDDPTA
ncbi:Trp biosynthesis-associated membrane protein [Actinoplanes sp. NPDC051851]|uniref:Trp biosynthesis-associated membrane protein n=1 Tax=Actinoplanes sp. NPDC051851 TaxID=3154753 RepID=UPI003430AE8C